jgi:putative CocE/NonD family hydrolase
LLEKPEDPESMRIGIAAAALHKLDEYVKEIHTNGISRTSLMRDVVEQLIEKLSSTDTRQLIAEKRLQKALFEYENAFGQEGLLFAGPLTMGPFDQRTIEEREDVLVYSTKPLTEAVEVTGPVRVKLWASSEARDTDFTAQLVDTNPDGKAIILAEGIVNSSYRNGYKHEKDLDGEIVEYEIDLWSTSNVLVPGHQITLEISSSSFPHFLPNPNTGKSLIDSKQTVKARQTILHNGQYPSHVILPVIPANSN